MTVAPVVVGVGATPQSGLESKSDYELAVAALRGALDDAGIDISEVDGLIAAGGSIEPRQMACMLGLTPNYAGAMDYNAGPFAVQHATFLIESGLCEVVACAYGHNPGPLLGLPSGHGVVLDADCGYINVNGIAGMIWTAYLARHRPGEELLGQIAVTARANGLLNPLAPRRPTLTISEYLAEAYVFWPLRRSDLALNNAGGAALVLTTAERARSLRTPGIRVCGIGRAETPATFETPGHLQGTAMRRSAKQAFDRAGISPADIDVLGVSDATTVAIVQALENCGFCLEGEAASFVASGAIALGGQLPVNPDGGHLAGGYLIGWLQQVELVRQLRGEAGERQVHGARWAMHSATGGQRERYLGIIYGRD